MAKVVIIGMMLWEQDGLTDDELQLCDHDLIDLCRAMHLHPERDATWTVERLP
jgi:hypothetical protein